MVLTSIGGLRVEFLSRAETSLSATPYGIEMRLHTLIRERLAFYMGHEAVDEPSPEEKCGRCRCTLGRRGRADMLGYLGGAIYTARDQANTSSP